MTDQQQQEQQQDITQTQTSVLSGGHEGGDQGSQGGDGDQGNQDTPVVTVPESADGYAVDIDGFDFDEFKAIDENKEFIERAHKAGMSNEHLKFMLSEYNDLLPKILQANSALDNEAAIATMKEAWGNNTNANFGFAKAAADNAIANGILTAEEVNSPEFGNNPLVLKMAAYFGSQLQEDTPPNNAQPSGSTDIQSLLSSEAYLNDKHPDHSRVYAQVQSYYMKQNK